MSDNEFAGTLYRTFDEMLDGIAYEWMTAGGMNSPAEISGMLADGVTPARLADEVIEGWGLNRDEAEPPHMEAQGYTRDDLIAAFQRFIEERPDIEIERAENEE